MRTLLALLTTAVCSAESLPIVEKVEWQPLQAQVARVVEALALAGEPFPAATVAAIAAAKSATDLQNIVDKHCLIGVHINPEARVKAQQGPAPASLVEQGWRSFLVKIQNEAGITPALSVSSVHAGPIPNMLEFVGARRWMDLQFVTKPPMKPILSGLEVEYRVLQIYAASKGKREGKLAFDVGAGSQDLGFRSDVDILFNVEPAATVTFQLRDTAGSPLTAALLVKDEQGRVYPSQAKRLRPDFFFQQQVYRRDGESLQLPRGSYTLECSRGPEYRPHHVKFHVTSASPQTVSATLERWIDPAAMGWFSGDHHIHAAGCAHYDRPTEGVYPEDMMRHVLGEDLKIGSVLTWGPGWYFQKTFFEGKDNALSTPGNRIRYDVEVSGHPSSHTGHLMLLRLKEHDYPGAKRIEEWPSWGMPVLKWARDQNAVVGYTHSGWGMAIKDMKVPSYEMPPFDGIGANEYVVSVTHGLADVISTVDTPYPWELSVWYHTLNVGYRTRISGETDFPCIYGERVGMGRSYVRQPKLDYDDWVAGLKQGRNYVSDGKGHLLDFRVNDVEMGVGKDVALSAPATVKVSAKVAALLANVPDEKLRTLPLDQKPYWDLERARIAGSRRVPVELVVNGVAVARQELEAAGTMRDVTFSVPIEHSSWVALRILGSAHTNPIWVTVGDKPVRASRRSAEWLRKAVDVCFQSKVNRVRLQERGEMVRAYDFARAAYDRLLMESPID